MGMLRQAPTQPGAMNKKESGQNTVLKYHVRTDVFIDFIVYWIDIDIVKGSLVEKLPSYGVLAPPPHLTTSLTSHMSPHISHHTHITPQISHHISHLISLTTSHQHLVMLECHFFVTRAILSLAYSFFPFETSAPACPALLVFRHIKTKTTDEATEGKMQNQVSERFPFISELLLSPSLGVYRQNTQTNINVAASNCGTTIWQHRTIKRIVL